ncbi:MAG: hypothetical protein GVY19_14180 [Bacteroidetes bacterium]|jgi:hypothetical protein|nr:hypothetical protein [Bacteroidota bacterium]
MFFDALEICKSLNPSDPNDDLINILQYIPQEKRCVVHRDRNRNNIIDSIDEFSSIDHFLVTQKLNGFIDSVSLYQYFNPLKIIDYYPIIGYFSLNQQL